MGNITSKRLIRGRVMVQNVVEAEAYAICAAWTPDTLPGMFLVDFAAAFPSVCRNFIWIALKAIGIPRKIIRAIRALYHFNAHFVRVGNAFKFVFIARSGVRQGCPLSSLIFVLVTDCINRALRATLNNMGYALAYADDVAIIVKQLRPLARILPAFYRRIGSISALKLNHSKCMFVPLWRGSLEDASVLFCNIFRLWKDFKIVDHGKYLGFQIGPGANDCEWESISSSILEMAHIVKSLKLSKFLAMNLFQCVGVSKLGFVSQLRELNDQLKDTETKARRLVVGGPENWAPSNFLNHLKEEKIFPISLRDFHTFCHAALCRTAHCNVVNLDQLESLIMTNNGYDENSLVHNHLNWINCCSVSCLVRARNSLPAETIKSNMGVDTLPRKIQSYIYSHFLDHYRPFSLVCVIKDRFLLRNWCSREHVDIYANRAVLFLKEIVGKVPPCVQFAVFKTFFNGWSTSARLQSNHRVCYICFECNGDDSIEHYATCSFMWNAFSQNYRACAWPQTLIRFLGLDTTRTEIFPFLACNMYSVMRATDIRRISQSISGPEDVKKLLFEHTRSAALQHKTLKKRIHNIWVDL